MTLKAWLRDARRPDVLGINARTQLKHYGSINSMATPYNTFCLHLAVNMRNADNKHAMFRAALGH